MDLRKGGELTSPAAFFAPMLRDNLPLALPGARHLRLPAAQVDTFRWLVDELHRNCTTFFSIPGMNSLYLFAEMEPPTALTTNAWMYLLDAEQQHRVIGRLEAVDRLCVVDHPEGLKFYTRRRPLPTGPLLDYLQRGFG